MKRLAIQSGILLLLAVAGCSGSAPPPPDFSPTVDSAVDAPPDLAAADRPPDLPAADRPVAGDLVWLCIDGACDASSQFCYRFLAGARRPPPPPDPANGAPGPTRGCNPFPPACATHDCPCAMRLVAGMAGCSCSADGARITVTCVAP